LHDVGHLFKQNSVFTFNFSVLGLLNGYFLGISRLLVVLERGLANVLANSGLDSAEALSVNLLILFSPTALEQFAGSHTLRFHLFEFKI
jgi:hypothetical protein